MGSLLSRGEELVYRGEDQPACREELSFPQMERTLLDNFS